MFMIIWIHFTKFSIIECSEHYASQSGFVSLIPQLIHGLCWCAVNTFILISGYFSIRPKAKSFFNLYLICAFYAGALYAVHLYFNGSHFNRWVIYNMLMPFGLWKSSTHWWFIPNYLILYILSPILNKVVDNISQRKFRLFLVLQALVIFYFGWYRNMGWNELGHNFINFIFLYFIGRYIAIYGQSANNKFVGGSIWLVAGLLMGLIDWIFVTKGPVLSWFWFNDSYSNPLCVIAAVALFMSFKSMHIRQSKVINWLAVSVLPIYLISDNVYFVAGKIYGQVTAIYDTYPEYIAYSFIFLLSIMVVLGIPVIDKLRIAITSPISRGLCNVWYKTKSRMQIGEIC